MKKQSKKENQRKTEQTAAQKQFRKQFFKKNKLCAVVLAIVLLLVAGINLWISYLLQQITDIATGRDLGPLGHICFLALLSLFAMIFILLVKRYVNAKFLERAMLQYKNFAFEEIVKKSISAFSKENTSQYISALTNDAASIETNYLIGMLQLFVEIVSFVGAFFMMLYYSPLLTGAGMLLALLPVAASLLCGNRLAAEEKKVSDKNEAFVGTVKDMLSGFSVIKSFQAEKEAMKLYAAENAGLERAKCNRRRTAEQVQLIGMTASVVAQLGVFMIGAYLAVTGKGITPGVLIVFVQLMNFVVTPIGTVPTLLANRKAANGLMKKLAEAVKAEKDTSPERGLCVEKQLKEGIRVEKLSFGYEVDKPVLKDFSYCFEAGKSYAVVGGSGSGKSTLLNLLMGGYTRYEGGIFYDSAELKQISPDSLYELMSIVQQNVFVFNNSVKDNITLFKQFEKEKIERAISMAGLSEFLEQKGEEYLCGENGCCLSGGERQRISIARCLLRETPVLLVDEATAALDAETAYAVTASILNIKDLTRIVVTHRLEESLLEKYDEILVLKNGTLMEHGSFRELLARKEYFYSLYNVAA